MLLIVSAALAVVALPVLIAVVWALNASPAMDHDPVPEVRALILSAQGHDPSAPIPTNTAWDRLIEALNDASTEVRAAHPELAGRSSYASFGVFELFWMPYDPALDPLRTGAVPVDGFDFESLDDSTRAAALDLAADMRIALLTRQVVMEQGRAALALDELRNGSSMLVSKISHADGWISVDIGTDFIAPHKIAMLCAHEMRMSLLMGDADEAIIWFDRGVGVVQALQRIPTMAMSMSANMAANGLLNSAIPTLTQTALTEVHLSRLEESLKRIDDRKSIRHRHERFSEIQNRYWASHRFTSSGIAVWRELAIEHGSILDQREKPPAITNLYGLIIPRRDAAMDALAEFHQSFQRWEQLPVSDRPDSPDHPRRAAKRVPAAYRFDSLSDLRPALVHRWDDDAALIAAFRAMLAIERFHRRNGYYPDTLEALVPEFVAEIPANPNQPGEPFAYERLDHDNELPVGFLIAARSRCTAVDAVPFGPVIWRSDDGSEDWLRRNALNLPLKLRSPDHSR